MSVDRFFSLLAVFIFVGLTNSLTAQSRMANAIAVAGCLIVLATGLGLFVVHAWKPRRPSR